MSILFIIFIVLQILALAYFLEALRRIRQRTKEYPLHDTNETLPFGFVRLRHVVTLYLLIYLLWVLVSFGLYFKWFGVMASPTASPSETFLNL